MPASSLLSDPPFPLVASESACSGASTSSSKGSRSPDRSLASKRPSGKFGLLIGTCHQTAQHKADRPSDYAHKVNVRGLAYSEEVAHTGATDALGPEQC